MSVPFLRRGGPAAESQRLDKVVLGFDQPRQPQRFLLRPVRLTVLLRAELIVGELPQHRQTLSAVQTTHGWDTFPCLYSKEGRRHLLGGEALSQTEEAAHSYSLTTRNHLAGNPGEYGSL